MPVDAFISYSHANTAALDSLHKHLAMLKRDGAVGTWTDHGLLPGAQLNAEIDAALERSGLFIALVSPDYLASRYCYDREFQHALRLFEARQLRIVPVIVEPCDWRASPLVKFVALPKDGKPISEWTNANNAYLDVVMGLRRILTAPASTPPAPLPTTMSSRRPRVKQDFDAIQRGEYTDKAFDVIRGYFQASCAELNEIGEGNLKAKFELMSNTAFTCSVVNRAKQRGGEAHITVRNSKGALHFGDISYVYQRNAENNISNGMIRVESDDYSLFLITDSFLRGGGVRATPQEAADVLWREFVGKAGIEYE